MRKCSEHWKMRYSIPSVINFFMYTLKHRKKFLIYGLVHLPSATRSFFCSISHCFWVHNKRNSPGHDRKWSSGILAEIVAVSMFERITTVVSRIIFRNSILKIGQQRINNFFRNCYYTLILYFFLSMTVTSVLTMGSKVEAEKTLIN